MKFKLLKDIRTDKNACPSERPGTGQAASEDWRAGGVCNGPPSVCPGQVRLCQEIESASTVLWMIF